MHLRCNSVGGGRVTPYHPVMPALLESSEQARPLTIEQVEIVTETNRRHDVETKRVEYALNGIPEYWIVDPENRCVTVLTLNGTTYTELGNFGSGDTLTSALLDGLKLNVKAMFDEAEAQA